MIKTATEYILKGITEREKEAKPYRDNIRMGEAMASCANKLITEIPFADEESKIVLQSALEDLLPFLERS